MSSYTRIRESRATSRERESNADYPPEGRRDTLAAGASVHKAGSALESTPRAVDSILPIADRGAAASQATRSATLTARAGSQAAWEPRYVVMANRSTPPWGWPSFLSAGDLGRLTEPGCSEEMLHRGILGNAPYSHRLGKQT